MTSCGTTSRDGRRHFWTTQPVACGTRPIPDACGGVSDCARPGLSVQPVYDDCDAQELGCYTNADGSRPPAKLIGATIATNDYIRSIALNILMTDQQPKPIGGCRPTPGRRGGYWADAFRTDGYLSGSRIRQLPPAATILDSVRLAQFYAQDDLQRLVAWGLASKVTAEAVYKGGGVIALAVTIDGEQLITLSGSNAGNGWFWQA